VRTMISIKDIARLADVSVSTVSRVINGKTCVAEDKRLRIEQAIKETGFVPNRAARDMVMKNTSKVGIFLPDTFNQFQRQLFSEIAHNLEVFGYYSSFFFVATDKQGEQACLQKLKSERLDGVILLREIEIPEFRTYLLQNHIPTILVTFENAHWEGATSIHISEEEAAAAAVSHLIQLGHQEIALMGAKKFSFGTQRELGYKRALDHASIPYNPELTMYVDSYNIPQGKMGMQKLLERNVPFTALFAITDELALGAIRLLQDCGYSVPQDISVIGFDDIEISSFTIPRLSTIQQPLKEMGRLAVSLLHDKIKHAVQEQRNIHLPFVLIERESTVCRN